MNVVALISGGKDSCFNMMQCIANGHSIVALANLYPAPEAGTDELDSFMFQTVGHDVVSLYGECMDIPLFRRPISGGSVVQDMDYDPQAGDEVEDLFELLAEVKRAMPEIQAVSVGAILSNYQRIRVEHVCSRLGLVSLSYLWRRDQRELLSAMIDSGIDAIIVKVAAMGLKPIHLGRPISSIYNLMCDLNDNYGSQVCGEGGEYETVTLDCPIFKRRIVIDEFEVIKTADEAFATVAHYRIKEAHTEEKDEGEELSDDLKRELVERFRTVPVVVENVGALDWSSTRDMEMPVEADLTPVSRSQGRWHTFSDIVSEPNCVTPPTSSELASETQSCLQKAEELLAAKGLTWADVVAVHAYLRNMDSFASFNSVYNSCFRKNPPARVTVGTVLPKPFNLRLDLIATDRSIGRDHMHVQSISYWAPANIGPYSQTVTLAGLTFVAGQIGLTPHTMKLPSRTTEEIGTSLSNLQAVVSGAGRDLATGTVSCICYITDSNLIEPARASWESIVDARVPLVFAPVAGLPRGANIEWEVVVTNPESVIRYDSDDEDDERNGAGHYQDGNNDEFEENGNLDFRGSSSVSCALRARRHGSYFGCIGTIKGISSESMELAFGTLLDKMRSAISSFSPTASKNLFAARILHDGGIATNNLRLISNDSKTGFPDVAVAWVPVLPSPEFQIAVCVHGQLDRS